MSPRALLLSPDDQAVNAITGVLEELSVSCERPLDGVSAAKKLNSERFDLVLVDCDNLPAAKLIFDVCRRSHGGVSVPVAIVDGRVGLPTAFRLGAELILTKPVAKDQARITVRTAVGRIKKDYALLEAKPVEDSEHHESAAPKALTAAAGATGAGATQLPATTPIGETTAAMADVSTPLPEPVKTETAVASSATAAVAPTMSSVAADLFELKSSAALESEPAETVAEAEPASKKAASGPTSSKELTPAPTAKLPVITEKEFSEDAVVKAMKKDEPSQPSPTLAAYAQPKKQRGPGLLVTVLVVAVLAGGFYAAWMYQPAFRDLVIARLKQANALLSPQTQRAINLIRPSAAPAHPKAAPSQQPKPPQRTSATPQQSTPTSAMTTPVSTAHATRGPEATALSIAVVNSPAVQEQKKMAAPAVPENAVPEAKDLVILSSKGAEKRLLHRVEPVVPAGAHAQSLEATVVLKAMIDENGTVTTVQPVEGDRILADAAAKAVKQWRYKPYVRDGKAVPFQTIVLVDFQ